MIFCSARVLLFAACIVLTFIFKVRNDAQKVDTEVQLRTNLSQLQKQLRTLQNFQPVDLLFDPKNPSEKQLNKIASFKASLMQSYKKSLLLFSSNCIIDKYYPVFLNAYLERYLILIQWDNKTFKNTHPVKFYGNLMKYFAKRCCSINIHFLNEKNVYYRLDCGHNACQSCIWTLFNPSSYSKLREIECKICGEKCEFNIEGFAEMLLSTVSEPEDPFKVLGVWFYCENAESVFKKCPKNTCNCVVVFKSSASTVRKYISRSICAESHDFCAYCNASIEHAPLKCIDVSSARFYSIFWQINFAISEEDSADELCVKCGRKMYFIEYAAVKNQFLVEFLEGANISVCIYCKHIEAHGPEDDQKPFHQALLWHQKACANGDQNLIHHTKILKNGHMFLLSYVLLLLFRLKSNNYANAERVMAVLKFMIHLFKRCFEYYATIFGKKRPNDVTVKNVELEEVAETITKIIEKWSISLQSKPFSLTNLAVRYLEESIQNFETDPIVMGLTPQEILHTLNSFFDNVFIPEYLNAQYTVQLAPGVDPLDEAVNRILQTMDNEFALRSAVANHLNRLPTHADLRRMARKCLLDADAVAANLRQNMEAFVRSCGISVLKTCIEKDCRYKIGVLETPECGHDVVCRFCAKQIVKQQFAVKELSSEILIPCFYPGCTYFFSPNIVYELFENDLAFLYEYEHRRLDKYWTKVFPSEIIKCSACEVFYSKRDAAADVNAHVGLSPFVVQNKLYLRTFKCFTCRRKACFNCKKMRVHYSTPCGISTNFATAIDRTMCPFCKNFDIPNSSNEKTKCSMCGFEFCYGCGVERKPSIKCLNLRHLITSTTSPEIFEELRKFRLFCRTHIERIVKTYHTNMHESSVHFVSYKKSKDQFVSATAAIIEEVFAFWCWHVFTQNHIGSRNLRQNSYPITMDLYEMRVAAERASLLLVTRNFEDCFKELERALSTMKRLHERAKNLDIATVPFFSMEIFFGEDNQTPAAA